jgi:hypothetical protein
MKTAIKYDLSNYPQELKDKLEELVKIRQDGDKTSDQSDEYWNNVNKFYNYILDNKERLGPEICCISMAVPTTNYGLPINQTSAPSVQKICKEFRNYIALELKKNNSDSFCGFRIILD